MGSERGSCVAGRMGELNTRSCGHSLNWHHRFIRTNGISFRSLVWDASNPHSELKADGAIGLAVSASRFGTLP